jgi:hypothetical protein
LRTEIENASSALATITLPPTPLPIPTPVTNTRGDIVGSGSLDKKVIVDYICLNNPAAIRREVENLVDAYIMEAWLENINHDIAVAQMCYATDYLKNRRLVNVHNYGDFAAINGVPVTYTHVNEGVRAHIQHLKGYATFDIPKASIVDKRYMILITERILGTVKTLDALFKVWAPADHQNYGNGINNILDSLYRISGS